MIGTLYTNDDEIKENLNKIKEFRKKGNIFSIATGNNFEKFKKVIQKYEIEYDYLILDHGTVIKDKEDNVLNIEIIDKNIVDKIVELLKKEEVHKYIEKVDIFSDLKNNVNKISIIVDNIEYAKYIKDKIDKQLSSNITSYLIILRKCMIEIIKKDIDKSFAIKKIIDTKQIKKENVFVVGDDVNDIEMIKEFDGYRMEKASEELIRICNKKIKKVSDLVDKII